MDLKSLAKSENEIKEWEPNTAEITEFFFFLIK